MKTFVISLLVTLILAVGFVVGLVTTTTTLSIASFCLWTPSVLTLGYSVGRMGLKIAIQSSVR